MTDYTARIAHYRQTMQLADQIAAECQMWAQEYYRAAEYWRDESRHAALLLSLTLTQKWRAGNDRAL